MTEDTLLSEKAIRKYLKGFDKFFGPYNEKLVGYYGDDVAERIRTDTLAELEAILPTTPAFPGRMNIFNVVMGVNAKMVSFYKAMRANGKSLDDTGRILYEVAQDEHEAIPGPIRWAVRKFMFSPFFLMLTRSSAKKVHGHSQGWKIDYIKGDGVASDWYFDCQDCGVIKYFKKHGVMELAKYCNFVDYLQGRVFSLGFENPKNIGLGDHVCIERFKEGRNTLMPDNLRDIATEV